VDAAVSCQACACPSRAWFQSFHMELEPGRAYLAGGVQGGAGPVVSHIAGAQQGLKGGGLRGIGVPVNCRTSSGLGSGASGGWGIPVVLDLAAWPRSEYPGVVWVWFGAGGWPG
jgi:hypothetical protein